MTYALGLIDDQSRLALHLIRKIRNEFAHVSYGLSFRHSSISSRCGQLVREKQLAPRQQFTRAAFMQIGILYATLQAATPRRLRRKASGSAGAFDRLRKLRNAIDTKTEEHYLQRVLNGEDLESW
jgi:hypothetical protein